MVEMQLERMRQQALSAFVKCCKAVSPFARVKEVLSCDNDILEINNGPQCSKQYGVKAQSVVLVSFGKAAVAMAEAAESTLGRYLKDGIVIAPHGISSSTLKSTLFHGAENNLPDEDSVDATKTALNLLSENNHESVTVLFLISGGGSALFCKPCEGLSLEEKLAVIKNLVSKGSDIVKLNTYRSRLSDVKGGKTLRYISNAKVISLIISDIIGDPVDFIASGPTVPRYVENSKVETSDDYPENVNEILSQSPSPSYTSCDEEHFVIVNNALALKTAREHLEECGFETVIVSGSIAGDAQEVGEMMAKLIASDIKSLNSHLSPYGVEVKEKTNLALLFGGETTVKITGNGSGGRNQHMVLSCLRSLLQIPKPEHSFIFLSAGTDGLDGPTDAAGAIISDIDLNSALLPQVERNLSNCNSYNFWKQHHFGNNHIITGPTGTNVMDVQMILLKYQ